MASAIVLTKLIKVLLHHYFVDYIVDCAKQLRIISEFQDGTQETGINVIYKYQKQQWS